MQRLTDDKRAEVAARRDTVGRLNILFSTLKDAETGQRGYLLTLNPSYLRPFDSAQARIKKDLQQLAVGLDATQKAAPDFSHLLNLIPQKLNELTQTVDLASQGKIDEALSIVRANEGKNFIENRMRQPARFRRFRDILSGGISCGLFDIFRDFHAVRHKFAPN